jgi:GT2 family glycosyltransferase
VQHGLATNAQEIGATPMRIAGLVACYNRVALTLRCLTSLFEAFEHQDATLELFLVDDGSPDKTGEIVKQRFPQVHVITGTGSLYWNPAMCWAYAAARAAGPFDAYLLFNDDVELLPDSVGKMISSYVDLNRRAPSVLAGPVCEKATGKTTYGGLVSTAKYRPLAFDMVPVTSAIRECDTFQANFVLVPAKAMDQVGGPDPVYHQCYADVDLGLVLRERGCKTYLYSDHIGYCEGNPLKYWIPTLGARIRALYSRRDPLSDRIYFTYKRYAWPLATVIAVAQVARALLRTLRPAQSYRSIEIGNN